MYSLLLMSAVATGGDTASFGWRSAGCSGCYGTVAYTGCSGSCHGAYAGCYGSSCHGSSCHGTVVSYGCCGGSCYGSSCHGSRSLFGGMFGRNKSCHGSSCHGSCYGGCWGSSCHGCSGTVYYHQGCYGSMAPLGGCTGCQGMMAPAVVMPPATTPAPAPAPMPAPAGGGIGDAPKKTSANITIELPADAVLTVDGVQTASTGAVRQFHTPELVDGQAFFYDMTATVVVGGKAVTEDLRVVVRAGEAVSKSFGKLIAAASAGEKAVAVK